MRRVSNRSLDIDVAVFVSVPICSGVSFVESCNFSLSKNVQMDSVRAG